MDGRMSKDQVEFLALIDTILLAIKQSKDINLEALLNNVSVSVNPFDYLLQIISKFVGYDEMMEFLVKTLTSSLPAIETGIKGVLLANLKNILSCTTNPMIPQVLRKDPTLYGFNNNGIERGFVINTKSIDYKNILGHSPNSEIGSTCYFGTSISYKVNGLEETYYRYVDAYKAAESQIHQNLNSDVPSTKPEDIITSTSEIESIYELARANDFNAFLWFVINHGNISNVNIWELNERPFNLGEKTITVNTNDAKFTPQRGDLFYVKGNKTNVLSMCIKSTTPNGDAKEYQATLVPFSSTNNSGNWYVNRSYYFKYLLPKNMQNIKRDYNTEFAICNVAYEDRTYDANTELLYPYGNLRISILPEPTYHIPTTKEIPMRLKFLFDANGNPNKDGKYSIMLNFNHPKQWLDKDGNETDYVSGATKCRYSVKSNQNGSEIGTLEVDLKTRTYEFEPISGKTDNDIYEALYECYPGLTVYEFNYDFVMGMQLFDPKVVAVQLLSTVTGLVGGGVSIGLKTSKTESVYQMRISEVVKEIIERDAYEVSDCFFTFSNAKYDELLTKAEQKRAEGYGFVDSSNRMSKVSLDDAYSILNEFNDSGTLEENEDVFIRAFNSVIASITSEVLPEDRYNIRLDIVTQLIKALAMSIIDVLLSPKIILLFAINQNLLGKFDLDISFEDFLEMIKGLLIQIITELRDMILQMIMDWALAILGDLADGLRSLLLEEQARFYSELLKRLIEECKINFPLFGHRKLLDSQLDVVDYADIDEVEQPKDSNC